MESLGKNARSLLLQGKRNINVSNLQNYFRIQNVGNLLGVLSDCEELMENLLGGCLTCEELDMFKVVSGTCPTCVIDKVWK